MNEKIQGLVQAVGKLDNLEQFLLKNAKDEQETEEIRTRFDAVRQRISDCIDSVTPAIKELREGFQSRVLEIVEDASVLRRTIPEGQKERVKEFAASLADALGIDASGTANKIAQAIHAKLTGVSFRTVYRWTMGDGLPPTTKIEKIIEQLRGIKVNRKPIEEGKLTRVRQTYAEARAVYKNPLSASNNGELHSDEDED